MTYAGCVLGRVGVIGLFELVALFFRFLYSFKETDFFGVGETRGGGGDFFLFGVVSFIDGVSSRFLFCPEALVFDALVSMREKDGANISESWNAPGSVGLRGRGIRGVSSKQNAGGNVGLKNGGSPLLKCF